MDRLARKRKMRDEITAELELEEEKLDKELKGMRTRTKNIYLLQLLLIRKSFSV